MGRLAVMQACFFISILKTDFDNHSRIVNFTFYLIFKENGKDYRRNPIDEAVS